MFTVTNNTGRTLTLYDGGTVIVTIANGATGTAGQLNVGSVDYGGAIFGNRYGDFANGATYTATYDPAAGGFGQNNILFSNGLPGGNVRFA